VMVLGSVNGPLASAGALTTVVLAVWRYSARAWSTRRSRRVSLTSRHKAARIHKAVTCLALIASSVVSSTAVDLAGFSRSVHVAASATAIASKETAAPTVLLHGAAHLATSHKRAWKSKWRNEHSPGNTSRPNLLCILIYTSS